jgi:glyoxylase-like metal-dependent hydrolase (beta-lactamase superfamily II)
VDTGIDEGRRAGPNSLLDAGSSDATWTITALDTGSSLLDKSMLTYTVGMGEIVRIPRVIWLLRGASTVIVDASVPMLGKPSEFIGEDFTRTPEQEPANALKLAGVDPNDVEFVVLTHLHWDHAGNCDLFPEARVLVQEAELRYAVAPGRFFRKSFLSPLSGWGIPPYFVPGLDVVAPRTEILPGLWVVPAPGHTPGSQAVVAQTQHGSFAIAGDAVCTYENIEQDIPPGFHVDVDRSMETYDSLRSVADHVLPSHDYEVFSDGNVTTIDARHARGGRASTGGRARGLRRPELTGGS